VRNVTREAGVMAGGKKKKKPASNPARGFATTSIASKPREIIPDPAASLEPALREGPTPESKGSITVPLHADTDVSTTAPATTCADDFEKQLEESELQILVEKYSQKSKRDAARQVTRLQTDRRLLRSQADALNTRRWLPPELMEEILNMISVDFQSSGVAIETSIPSKALPEEDLTVKLWTLQQTLTGAGFAEDKLNLVLAYILGISEKVVSGNKDSIWGLEESLDWLAIKCSRTELPDYENWQRKTLPAIKATTGLCSLIFVHFHVSLFPDTTPFL